MSTVTGSTRQLEAETCTDAALPRSQPPRVESAEADRRFRQEAGKLGFNADGQWVGRYVEYEWEHVRHFLEAFIDVSGKRVLEFGCHIGATAIVLAKLGGTVEGVDVAPKAVRLGRFNAARYGCQGRVTLRCLEDTRRLPFPDASFDVVICNSVLEYVPRELRPPVFRELDRVLRPGGVIFILGTSSRLWPREVHSRRWFANYVPYALERILGRRLVPQRGMWPGEIKRAWKGYSNLMRRGGGYFTAKARCGSSRKALFMLRLVHWLVRWTGWTAGELTPSINVVLRKKD